MGEQGFPALLKVAKKFKVKGKGHEVSASSDNADVFQTADLNNLLNVYQMWAHHMFPKGDFAHTLERVEVVCRKRRMVVSSLQMLLLCYSFPDDRHD